MERMWHRELVIFLSLLLFSISLFAQNKTSVDCENRIGPRYTEQHLNIRLRTIKKNFVIYSQFGYFDKSLAVLNFQLKGYGVSSAKRKKIINQIKEMSHWDGEKVLEVDRTPTKNAELISIYSNTDITNITTFDPLTSILPLTQVIEKYLSEKQAKKVIEALLAEEANSSCGVSFLDNTFCIYQRKGAVIEGYGTIDKSFKNYEAFLKDYLGKCSIGI